ncbi:MAG TPA: Bro-N domain-containing protein [archaeon]|nr:Bro-N domain-containing protein [archaeon]
MEKENALIVFQNKKIRRTWFNEEWWFVAIDIVEVLTDSIDPSGYLKDIRRRDESFNKGWGQIATPLSIQTAGGKQQLNCISLKGAFRLIQSIPSPKAEPFKRWLAKVGYERIQEIQDPELIQKRLKELYRQKGYSDSWIEKRLRGIIVRDELTDEWKKRGIKEEKDFSILTAEISKATFDIIPSEYKKIKNLKNENLRDHMDDLELLFIVLGETLTKEIIIKEDPKELEKAKTIANRGGKVAGIARVAAEKELERKIISESNYLAIPEKRKRLRFKNPKCKKPSYNTKSKSR